MNAERHPAPLGRADLIWCFFSIDEKDHAGLASLLGFEEGIADREEKKSDQTFSNNLEEPEVQFIKRPIEKQSVTKAVGSSFYRVKNRQREDISTETTNHIDKPDWFTEAKPSYFQETASRIPARHRVRPDFPPLLPWSRLWPFLQRTLGGYVPTSKPDMNKLVKQVSQGKMIRQIPKRNRYTWSPIACVLIDINDDNFPYRHDFIRLQYQLADWRGHEGLDIQFIEDEPDGYVVSYRDEREIVREWRPPASNIPLLILSDMGIHKRVPKILNSWISFGQQLNIRNIRATVLMPIAERDVDKRFLKYFNCVIWDSNSHLRPLQGDNAELTSDQKDLTERLLALCFPAVRVDLGLLRSIRHLLPAQLFDVGHEAAIWHNKRVTSAGDEWGWQGSSKGEIKGKFIEHWSQLTITAREQFIEQLGRHHAQLPDELYFEAMHELLLLNIALPQEVKDATEAFMAMLVKTYAEQPESVGLDLWVKRYLSRHDHKEIRFNSEIQRAFMAYEKMRSHSGDASEIIWPEGIDPKEVLRYINRQQVLQVFLLRQKGMALELVEEGQAQTNADDFGSQAVTLLKLMLADSHIFHCYHADDGQYRQVSLHLDPESQTCFKFPSGTNHKLQVGTETITIEVQTASDKPDWMVRRGMGAEAIYAETCSRAGKFFVWYWHPPALGQISDHSNSEGSITWQTYPGFWFYQAPNKDYKPAWADYADRDRYGLYADVTIAGIIQRFRWISPGSFQMGSSISENGRFDNETQHQVNLSQAYWLADTACNQALWQAVMGENPSHFKGENRPVEQVSWDDIQLFLGKLNTMFSDLALRLPTEAEWENACRADTTSPFSFDGELTLDKVNFRGTWDDWDNWGNGALQQTAEVKSYPPNRWGLYEMHGNVYEWCQDWYGEYSTVTVTDPQGPETGAYRIFRGGSWNSGGGRRCRSARRNRNAPVDAYYNFGFRLARDHEPGQASVGQQSSETYAGDGRLSAGGKQKTEQSSTKKTKGVLDNFKDLFKK